MKHQYKSLVLGLSLSAFMVGCGSTGESGSLTGSGFDTSATESTRTLEPQGADSNTAPEAVTGDVMARALPTGEGEVTAEARALGYVPNELIVQYRPGKSEAQKANARGRVGARRKELVRGESSEEAKGELELAKIPPGLAVAEAVRRVKDDPSVEFAEPNYVYTNGAVSQEPYFTAGHMWGLKGPGTGSQFGSQADAAWNLGNTGSGNVYVGVIDEGINFSHEDLQGVVGNPREIPGDRKDNDRNGYIDDHYGWDFATGDNTVDDGPSDDHGTHVAGTIGAKANGVGVVGVNWNVKLISAKFLGANGGTLANAIKAVDYFTDLKKRRGVNIVATNNSWGGGGYSIALLDAIKRSRDADILFIASAGNGGADQVGDDNDATPQYPASYVVAPTSKKPYDNVISVAAINSAGAKSSFSNYGATSVDLGAPGEGILSTYPGGYAFMSGTSMAAPHVSGAAALYAASRPGVTAAQIRSAILNNAVITNTPSLSGATRVATQGRLNVSNF